MRHLVFLALVGCAPKTAPVVSPAVEAAASGPHGRVPDVALSVPEFAATSDTGEPRSRADLLGHPTVVWFFPAAGTPG